MHELNEPPDLPSILEFVAPMILDTRDRGDGHLTPLPIAGTEEWNDAPDRTKWAAIAVLALEAAWAAERGPNERIAYSEAVERVAAEMNWGAYGYELGYEKGRRDQAAIERQTRRNAERRKQREHDTHTARSGRATGGEEHGPHSPTHTRWSARREEVGHDRAHA